MTGRDQLAYNVVVSWIVHVVVLAAGFIVPRQIDVNLGQAALGIWDFGWAIVKYMGYAGLGVTSALNRYTATYRAEGRIGELNATASAVFLMQLIFAAFVAIVVALLVVIVPHLFTDHLGSRESDAAWVLALLGAGAAVQLASDPARGLLAGFHRWDINNVIIAVADVVTAAGMVAVLMMGGGLVELGVVYLVVTALAAVTRFRMCYFVFPEFNLSLRSVAWLRSKVMLSFGIKTALLALPQLVTIQTTNILLAAAAGPATLAIFARPLALVRHIDVLVRKFAFMLTPISSSLQGLGQHQDVARLAVSAGRHAAFVSIVLFSLLAVWGNDVVLLWMGPDYVNQAVVLILAAGMVLPTSQSVAAYILVGLDAHGRAGRRALAGTLLTMSLALALAYWSGWSPQMAAVVVVASLTIGPGVIVPLHLCVHLELPVRTYVLSVFPTPLAIGAVLVLSMKAPSILTIDEQYPVRILGTVIGLMLAAILAWNCLLSADSRSRLRSLLLARKFGRRQGPPLAAKQSELGP